MLHKIFTLFVILFLAFCLFSPNSARSPLVNPSYYHPQWAHCAIEALHSEDTGALANTSCLFNKTDAASSLRVTYNGILRITSCTDCCMRWFVTLNGQECSSPAPIDAIIYATDVFALSIHRGSTVTGW